MIKHGLDSSVLINLIVCYDSSFEPFRERGYSHNEDIFYFHDVSIPEILGVLMNRYKFTKDEVRGSIAKLIKEFNLMRIWSVEEIDSEYEDLVEKTNLVLIKTNPAMRIGERDIIILAGFLRSELYVIHSSDKGFLRTAKELNLRTCPVSKEDLGKEKRLFRFMKKRFG